MASAEMSDVTKRSNFKLGGSAERFPSFCSHVETQAFRCANLWDALHPGQNHMPRQTDLLLLRQSRANIGEKAAPIHGVSAGG